MSSVSSAGGAQSAPVTLEWRGRTLQLRPLTWKLISELERWLIQREADARTDAMALLVERGVLTADKLAERIEAFVDDAVNNGRYSFGSPRMQRVLSLMQTGGESAGDVDAATMAAKFKMIALILGVDVDDAINVMHEKKSELAMKLGLVLGESMPAPKEAGAA